MPQLGHILFTFLALAGHGALCVTSFNRINASGIRWLKSSEKMLLIALILPSVPLMWQTAFRFNDLPHWLWVYCLIGISCLASKIPGWLRERLRRQPAALIDHEQTELSDPDAKTRRLSPLWSIIPGNQSDQLVVEEKTLWVPRLPREFTGLTITHLSDLHLTGRVSKAYFEMVVEQANAMESQLIAITGDFIDQHHCLPWLTEVLGRLRAEHGVYFVLGNHDARVGEAMVRTTLEEAGLMSLGGRTRQLELSGKSVLLAGDERPWFEGPPTADDGGHALKLLLSHTPDRYEWARKQSFDVMLAGHTHGGQVRLPVIGAVISPSRYGTQYACGVFDEPPTVMHVSRGVSAQQPWRWLCPPEITQLKLVPDARPLTVAGAAEDAGKAERAARKAARAQRRLPIKGRIARN